MTGPHRPRRGEHCPSALRLDQWLAGELSAEDGARVEAHVAGCAPCQSEREQRLETRNRFTLEAPPFAALASSAQRRREPWIATAAMLAAAAALLLVLNAPWRVEPAGSDSAVLGTRAKGSVASFGWVVRRGEHVFAPGPDERLRAGDALRFTVSAREPVFVAILGLDSAGRLSVYHPDTVQLLELGPGQDQPLPAAIALDATPGDEHMYGIFCRRAFAVATLQEAIRSVPDAPALPEGCQYERHLLRKEAP